MSIYFGKVGVAGSNGESGITVKVIPDFTDGEKITYICLTEPGKIQNIDICLPKRGATNYCPTSQNIERVAVISQTHSGVSSEIYSPIPSYNCSPDFNTPTDVRAEAEMTGYTLSAPGFIQFFDIYNKSNILTTGYEISGTIDGFPVYNSRVDVSMISDESGELRINDSAVNQLIIPVTTGSVVRVGSDSTRGPANNFTLTYYPVAVSEII